MKLLLLAAFAAGVANAQDARDEEIFGAPAQAAPGAPSAPSAPDSKLADTMQVGGRLELRETGSLIESETFGEGPLDQLKQADVYFDARPNPNVRAFLRARFSEDSAAADKKVQQDIDELWIKSDWARAVFFTAGKQHVKWGSGRLWNPTDFTASGTRDPFDLFDRRLGQTMVKVHIPDEKRAFNYYALALLDDAARNDAVGGALRGEFAFLGSGELALSLATRRSSPHRLGVDVSSALGPVDVYAEAAFSKRQKRTFYKGEVDPASGALPTAYQDEKKTFSQIVGGLNKTWKYSDDDNLTIGAEYFQNGLGYDDRDLEVYSLVNRQSEPLYVGRRYAGAYVTAPSPGSWNDTAFYLNAIRNLSDKTATARFTTTWTFHKEAVLEAFVSRCFGDYGELCFRVPESYQQLQQSPVLPPAQKQALAALPAKRTLLMAGGGFSMKF